MEKINFAPLTLRKEISSRGGGIEISLDYFGYGEHKMSAFQNYLGGGMLGKVEVDCTMENRRWKQVPKLVEASEQLKEYFFNLTNPDTEWESQTFEVNQNMPTSAY